MTNGPQDATNPSTPATPAASAALSRSAAVPLRSLTPRYVEEDHGTYVRRLEEAVKDPDNLNIAVTGRYGAGKSSVLKEFRHRHGKSVEQLAISTLAPSRDDETTTDRIQKAIVNQLLYGASKKVGKNSRFSRIAVLTKPRALARAVAVVVCIGLPVYFFELYPTPQWTGSDEPVWQSVAVWTVLALVAVAVVGVLLRAVGGRSVSDVSAGPAAVSWADKSETPFDEYTDEIVHYFDTESKDIVVIEDLDRFEDPDIFEALRELNLLLNNTVKRRAKRRGNRVGRVFGWVLERVSKRSAARFRNWLSFRWATRIFGLPRPLRFVYAVKDSVFEKLDTQTANAAEGDEGPPAAQRRPMDAAVAETQRANRTKFFDVVIPLVPFISHRNARELLKGVLEDAGVTNIDRKLMDTVARHTTDMRLLRNMCNEYLLFAERLLEGGTVAPELDHNKVFALVAYKNFHHSDFENIARGDSALDRLYDLHQMMVRDCIAAAENAKSAQRARPTRVRERDELIRKLSARLHLFADAALQGHLAYNSGRNHICFKVGTTVNSRAASETREFWAAVVQADALVVQGAADSAGSQARTLTTLDHDALERLVPEAMTANRWASLDAAGTEADIDLHDLDIYELRRADFAALAKTPKFTVSPPEPVVDGDPLSDLAVRYAGKTFAQVIEGVTASKLAADLVKGGFIDRNFSLYAAQFYGHFSGAEVATFIVRHVQPNKPNFHYDLREAGAAANVLVDAAQAGEDLLHTTAAYNIDLVNHLLSTNHADASQVIETLTGGLNEGDIDATLFLAAYLSSETAERSKLITRLAQHRWRPVFTHLVSSDKVPNDARPALVSAALTGADPHATYDLNDDVRQFIVSKYKNMPALTEPHDDHDPTTDRGDVVAERVDAVLKRTRVVIPDLTPVNGHTLRLLVARNGYALTAANVRKATGLVFRDISLDVAANNEQVYNFCIANLGDYLAAVESDPGTEHTIHEPATLLAVLNHIAAASDDDPVNAHLGGLLAKANPSAQLQSIDDAPQRTWEALAEAGLFRASLANIEAYRDTNPTGAIDSHLAKLIADANTIYLDEPHDTHDADGDEIDATPAAIAVLNTPTIGGPAARVSLAEHLGPPKPLRLASINAESSTLFALLIDSDFLAADTDSFTHFAAGGWEAIGPAIHGTDDVSTFLEPPHVHGMVADLLADDNARDKVGYQVVANLDNYVPDDGHNSNDAALIAAARYAARHNITLPADTVVRIAGAANTTDLHPTVFNLLRHAEPAATGKHVQDTFMALGPPYSQIGSAEKFDVPRGQGQDVRDLLDRLTGFEVSSRNKKGYWTLKRL